MRRDGAWVLADPPRRAARLRRAPVGGRRGGPALRPPLPGRLGRAATPAIPQGRPDGGLASGSRFRQEPRGDRPRADHPVGVLLQWRACRRDGGRRPADRSDAGSLPDGRRPGAGAGDSADAECLADPAGARRPVRPPQPGPRHRAARRARSDDAEGGGRRVCRGRPARLAMAQRDLTGSLSDRRDAPSGGTCRARSPGRCGSVLENGTSRSPRRPSNGWPIGRPGPSSTATPTTTSARSSARARRGWREIRSSSCAAVGCSPQPARACGARTACRSPRGRHSDLRTRRLPA